MKNTLLLILFSLGITAQENKLTPSDRKLFDGYKSAGDMAYSQSKFGKAAAQYRYAKQICVDCNYLTALIDSCNVHQKAPTGVRQSQTAAVTPAETKTVNPDDQEYFKMNAEMGALAKHGQLTQFTGMKYNFVTSRVQTYMSKHLNMYPETDDVDGNYITVLFKEKSAYNAPQKELTFKFKVRSEGADFIIEDCMITGDKQKLIGFYLNYWNTSLTVDENKTGIVAETRLLADNSVLYLQGAKSYVEVKRR